MDEMCKSNFKLKSIFTPKYLTLWATKTGELLIVRSIRGRGLLKFGGINSACDLDGFTISLLAFNHRETQCRLSFILEATTGKFASEQTRQVLSAKSLGLQLTENGRSMMYNKKRRGPSIEPWGTPMLLHIEGETLLLMRTYCRLFKKGII